MVAAAEGVVIAASMGEAEDDFPDRAISMLIFNCGDCGHVVRPRLTIWSGMDYLIKGRTSTD